MISFRDWLSSSASFNESNLADVDGDQQRLRDFMLVGVGRVDSASSWNHDPVHVAVVVGVIESRRAAEDIDGISVPPQQAVLTVVSNLLPRVTGDGIRIGDLQRAPAFAAF